MGAIDYLADSLGRRDEHPNQDLAVAIIQTKREDWVAELVENLSNKDKNIQSDCIKVLYEIGERGSAEMIASYSQVFMNLLSSKNNRLVWGAMTAIDTFVLLKPQDVFDYLPQILETLDCGSTITIDHGVSILAKLSTLNKYAETTFPLWLDQLQKCPPKQLPMYAERGVEAVTPLNQKLFVEMIENRIPEMEKDSQNARLTKVLKKFRK